MKWVIASIAMASLPAAAAPPLFADDFESGVLLMRADGGGVWRDDHKSYCSSAITAGSDILITGAAAHRGARGLRIHDADNRTGDGCQLAVIGELPGPWAGDYHMRVWLRITPSSGSGVIVAMDVEAPVTSAPPFSNFSINLGTRVLGVYAFQQDDSIRGSESPLLLQYGQWHLVEMATLGAGSTNGAVALWIDGVPAAQVTGFNFQGPADMRAKAFGLGQVWASPRVFQGELDYDDFRAGPTPHASTIGIVSGQSFAGIGDCVPLSAQLSDSLDGGLAAAPYRVTAALRSSGLPGEFFSDSACTTRVTSVDVVPPATGAPAYFRASDAGTASLSAQHPDFLSGPPAPVEVSSVKIISEPSTSASCGEPYRYSKRGIPDVLGQGPYRFSATGPDGFVIDEATGQIQWTPRNDQVGTHHLSLSVTTADGESSQQFDVEVRCLGVGCACQAAAPLRWGIMLALLCLRRRRVR